MLSNEHESELATVNGVGGGGEDPGIERELESGHFCMKMRDVIEEMDDFVGVDRMVEVHVRTMTMMRNEQILIM